MLPKLSDNQKTAVLSVLVLSLGVVAALLIRVPNLGADEWGWASIREINPLLAALILLLALTPKGHSRQGWKSLTSRPRTASRSRCDEMTHRCRDLHLADQQHTREVEPERLVVGVGVLERLTDAVAEFGVVQSLNPPTEGTVAHVGPEHGLERGVLRQTALVVEQVSDRDGGRCRLIAHAIARPPLTYFTFRRRNSRSR
jgi:hypothetical protein